ncbi:MAG: hypothetical protein HC796_00290 [Synechococcaceae cyanobacterium RL_1_2]|nr:hypothetical protein [Synechococcaceae cyanobacterium RL_1_2]
MLTLGNDGLALLSELLTNVIGVKGKMLLHSGYGLSLSSRTKQWAIANVSG